MTQSNPPRGRIRLPRMGLMLQLVTVILLPLTLLLVAITFGSLSVHQNAMRTLVGERDARLVTTAAGALSTQVSLRARELTGLGLLLSALPAEPISTTLDNTTFLKQDFDLGLSVLDPQGHILAASGDGQLWQAWATSPRIWQSILSSLTANPGKLAVFPSPITGAYVGLQSVHLDDQRSLVGAFSITVLVENTLVDILPFSHQLNVYLVDSSRRLLYQSGVAMPYSSSHPGIAEALQGQSGTLYVKVPGDEHVTAYSPVEAAGWALITEESWQAVATPELRVTQVAPLVLVPALLIMLLALWLGTRQVVRPLRQLEKQAATLAGGDFKSIQQPVGGIEEIQHLQAELVDMAHKVEEAQRSLHGYIGAINAAQEDERHRLARELHDDTLQALIALKQRIELVQLETGSASSSPAGESVALTELDALAGQTIENLRRLTGALRPAYLEDLGLVPALQVLSRETGEAMGIPVEFKLEGKERRLPAEVELGLFRMAQEALSNVSRHSQARQASVSLHFAADEISLSIQDDGVGFAVPDSLAGYSALGHYGLLGLQERAELMGARLVVHSAAGKGTRVEVSVPA